MASGRAYRTNWLNTWPHRPDREERHFTLANGEPSTHGASALFGAYPEVLTSTFTEEELRAGIFTAVAGVHDTDKDTDFPRSPGHYVSQL